MPSPSHPEEDVSEPTSPRPALLPSPFTHSDEQIETSPPSRGERLLPRPVQATSASIYEGDATVLGQHGKGQGVTGVETVGEGREEDEVLDEGEEQDDEEDDDYPAQHDDAGSLLPPQNFHPFFTLITDAITGETYHPSTYYVFSDDEPDVLTTASLHALDSYSPQPAQSPSRTAHPSSDPSDEVSERDEAADSERYVVIDLAPSGVQIHTAKSLSPEWAITGADIRGAPTFQASEDTEGAGGGEGLMLMLEGMGIQGPPPTVKDEATRTKKSQELLEEARKRGGGSLVQGMEELRVGLCGGLGVLDKIVGLDE
jgi:hypothetical protein